MATHGCFARLSRRQGCLALERESRKFKHGSDRPIEPDRTGELGTVRSTGTDHVMFQLKVRTVRATSPAFMARNASLMSAAVCGRRPFRQDGVVPDGTAPGNSEYPH